MRILIIQVLAPGFEWPPSMGAFEVFIEEMNKRGQGALLIQLIQQNYGSVTIFDKRL